MRLLNDHAYLKEYAFALCKDENKAGELVQDVLIKYWMENVELLALEPKALITYTRRMIFNRFIDIYRKHKRNLGLFVDMEERENYINDYYSVLKHIEVKETLTEVLDLIGKKSRIKESFHAFILSKYYGYSYIQIAAMMGGLSVNNVASKIMRVSMIVEAFKNDKPLLKKERKNIVPSKQLLEKLEAFKKQRRHQYYLDRIKPKEPREPVVHSKEYWKEYKHKMYLKSDRGRARQEKRNKAAGLVNNN